MAKRRYVADGAANRFRARVSACLAILALVAQMLAPLVHRMLPPPDAAMVAADLRAVFGDTAVLCVQAEDGRNAPAPARDCDDACPICQFHSATHALVLPTLTGPPTRIDSGAQTLGLAPAPSSDIRAHTAFAQPRAPPFEA